MTVTEVMVIVLTEDPYDNLKTWQTTNPHLLPSPLDAEYHPFIHS